jgi:carbamoyl-phosphate synthase small subunit
MAKEKTPMIKAVLHLEDGTQFEGTSIGAIGTTIGEIAFNTGMYGYQEIFTDPSYYGQILVMATAHIGNYATLKREEESDRVQLAGVVVKNFSDVGSRAGDVVDLQKYLVEDGIVGISDIDTRSLVRHIREHGAMNAILSSEELSETDLKERLAAAPSMQGLELSSKVTTEVPYEVGPEDGLRVALLDLGVKRSITQCLVDRGCRVRVFPMRTKCAEMLDWNPQGFMLSNGPGDPSAMPEVIAEVGQMVETGIPMFGICLGHQVLALSQGLKTKKMFNGHRGVNHPVKNLISGKSEITSQNHGFVVDRVGLDENASIALTHIHLNDDTVAGIALTGKPVFSVQYHPEASAGPHDSRYLFDDFVANMQVPAQV